MSRMKISGHFEMLPENAFQHCGDKRIKPQGIETAIAIAALAVAAGGAYMSYEAGQRQAEAQRNMAQQQKEASERQFKEQQRLAELENVRATRAEIRSARAKQATLINLGATTGTAGSTGIAGGVGSVGSQLASNLSYKTDVAAGQQAIGQAQLDYGTATMQGQMNMADAAAYGALGGALQSVGGTVFQGAGGFKTVFKK